MIAAAEVVAYVGAADGKPPRTHGGGWWAATLAPPARNMRSLRRNHTTCVPQVVIKTHVCVFFTRCPEYILL